MTTGAAMNRELENFFAELRADPRLTDAVDNLEEPWLVLTAVNDARAIEWLDSLMWIVRQPRSLEEKCRAAAKLTETIKKLIEADKTLPPGTSINLKELTGWK